MVPDDKPIQVTPDTNWCYIAVLSIVLFGVYYIGAHSYWWLEDSDPYEHASAVQFINEFNTPVQPAPYQIHYLLPYPPLYDLVATAFYKIVHAFNPISIPDTLKDFNALLCALAIPAFYLWSREKYGRRIGIWSSFFLFCIPCFMSHFIWSQTLAILLMFPAMYFFEKRSSWSILFMALVFITQPSVAAIFAVIMVIYAIVERRDYHLVALAIGASFLLYWLPIFIIYGLPAVLSQIDFKAIQTFPQHIYQISDFIIPNITSGIDQPTGIGVPLAILTLIGLYVACKERELFMIPLLAFCIIGTEAAALPVMLFPHRFWVFLAIPVCILSAMAIPYLVSKARILYMAAIFMVIIFCLFPKVELETSSWNTPWFLDVQQFAGWLQIHTKLPSGSSIFTYCSPGQFVDGLGFSGHASDHEAAAYRNLNTSYTSGNDHAFMVAHGYSYVAIDTACAQYYTTDTINRKLQQLSSDSGFKRIAIGNNSEVFIYEVER